MSPKPRNSKPPAGSEASGGVNSVASGSTDLRTHVPSGEEITRFRDTVYAFFTENGRDLPWRHSADPYHIVVSEVMLQQTQVERVLVKYDEFLRVFPDFASLAGAGLKEVLGLWQGLGYNRRALTLKKLATEVVDRFQGALPCTVEALARLPGLGKATASAVAAFAFHAPVVFMETNIRRVFLHHFFEGQEGVKDREILPVVSITLDRENPHQWYSALMDYGSALKKGLSNPNRRSAHYKRQPPFERSDRKIRGQIVALLVGTEGLTFPAMLNSLGSDWERTERILTELTEEGFVRESAGTYRIA
jgi:A/G-specific adenine glycosylase